MLEPSANTGEHALEIIHYLARLRLDPLRKRQRIIIGVGRELTGHEQTNIHFDNMAVGGHWLWRISDQMVYRCGHDPLLPRIFYWTLSGGARTVIRSRALQDCAFTASLTIRPTR